MQRNHKILILVLVLLLLSLAVATYFFVSKQGNNVPAETLEVFANKEGEEPYTDLDGNPVSLEQYLGKVLVVVSWASWSPFSVNDLDMLRKLSTEYDNSKVVFMAINRKETKDQAARYLLTQDDMGATVMVLDPRDNFYKATGGYAMPQTVIYDENGEVIQHINDVTKIEDIQNILKTVLTET